MSDSLTQNHRDFSYPIKPSSKHFLLGTTHGKLIPATGPNAGSKERAVFDWIREPNVIRVVREGKGTKRYVRKAPVVPSPIVDEMEAKHDAQLRGPLVRLQHLVEEKLQADNGAPVDLNLLKEEAVEIESTLNLLVQMLQEPKLIKYSRIKDKVMAYRESYVEGCRLLQEITDAWISVSNRLDRLEENVDLSRFEDTLNLFEIVREEVVKVGSQRMAHQIKDMLEGVENYVALDGSRSELYSSPVEDSSPQSLPIIPQSSPFNGQPHEVPSNLHSEHVSREDNFTPPQVPQVIRSIEGIDERAKSFLRTLGKLKECRDALTNGATDYSHVGQHRQVLEKELQELRRHLSESGTAKIWSEFLTTEKIQNKNDRLDTNIQDMFAANWLIRNFQNVYLGRKVSYSHHDKTYHDVAWFISNKLRAVIESASARQMDRLSSILDSKTTKTIISSHEANLANVNAVIRQFARAPEDSMEWIKLQGRMLDEILQLNHEDNLSHEQSVLLLKSHLKEVRTSILLESRKPHVLVLLYQMELWLSKLDVFNSKPGSGSHASVMNNELSNLFEWNVETFIGEIVSLKNAILSFASTNLKSSTPAQKNLLTRRGVVELQKDAKNRLPERNPHLKKIKEKLLRGSSKRFEMAQSLPLTAPEGMLQLSIDFGTGGRFSKHRGAITDLIGLITSTELYKMARACPKREGGESPELDLAEKLWKTYAPKKDEILKLAESWRPFGLIFRDIIEVMIGPQSTRELRTQSSSMLYETYQQTLHTSQWD
ncbi:hypothetical protein PTTG_29510 [Puccinia triticina 1-1 BBBD Race 1]|uniref:Uncharacterized protein n=1 Tax=Puccinia triticina (isolate 1-1 / race 1 (BBBD)) TaxID=630390 RepID=A0A180G3I5_PUCT1|nr:hypothetical protein PTTG_29510 [Puccinia triticina 1-1 BBBD Race 1]